MTTPIRPLRVQCLLVLVAVCVVACRTAHDEPSTTTDPVETARRFRALVAAAQFDSAQACLAPGARRWWNERSGPGMPYRVDTGNTGPWAAWDAHFGSRREEVSWVAGPRSAVLVQRETNDYFQLLERGWVTNEITYTFDAAGHIEGVLIRAIGERPPGRTASFREWARQNEPAEFEALMDGDEVDPSGDHPPRMRALLQRWRQATGLPPLDPTASGTP